MWRPVKTGFHQLWTCSLSYSPFGAWIPPRHSRCNIFVCFFIANSISRLQQICPVAATAPHEGDAVIGRRFLGVVRIAGAG
mmetsp:Transcript_30844/g.75041  ORF Transcript_30844/g.75041 Transcript_30844/m.75041 type:complete len:81 (+) Transcript_30844:473-715(+)